MRVAEYVVDAAVAVNAAGHAVVGAAEQGQAVFDGAENRIGHVLPLLGTVAEPAVIGEVDEEIQVVLRRRAGHAGERVFKADQRGRFGFVGGLGRNRRRNPDK